MHFYNVNGLLVRRWVPAQRRRAMETWTGNGWTVYPHVDDVLRHGRRLSDADALSLLNDTRQRIAGLPPWSADEASMALRSRARQAEHQHAPSPL